MNPHVKRLSRRAGREIGVGGYALETLEKRVLLDSAIPDSLTFFPPPLPEPGMITTFSGEGRLDIVEGLPVLRVEGTNYDMGYQHGMLLADWVTMAIARGKEEALKYLTESEFMMVAAIMRGVTPQKYIDEMQGMSDGVKDATGTVLDFNAVIFTNCYVNENIFACSQFAVTGTRSEDGHTLWARNSDWTTPADFIHNYAVMTVADPADGNAFISVTFAGALGVMTGMNEYGVVGASNASPLHDHTTIGTPPAILIRMGLEAADTAEEFCDTLAGLTRTVGMNFVVPDGRGDIKALELTGKAAAIFDTDDQREDHYFDFDTGMSYATKDEPDWFMVSESISDCVIRTNHFLDWGPWGTEPAHLQELQFKEDAGGEMTETEGIQKATQDPDPEWTVNRYYTLHDLITTAPEPIDVEAAINFLAYDGVGSGMTIHSAVFDTTSLDVWVAYAVTVPGTSHVIDSNNRPYVHYDFRAALGNRPPEGTIDSPVAGKSLAVGESIDLRGSGSDLDGAVTGWQWEINGPDGFHWNSTLEDPGALRLSVAGAYSVKLTVVDDLGKADTSPEEIAVYVRELPQPAMVDTPTGTGWLEILDGMPVLHVRGGNYDMGYQHGYLLSDWTIAAVNTVKERLLASGATESELMMAAAVLDGVTPEAYRTEMQGMIDGVEDATGVRLTYNDVVLVNCYVDISEYTCSQFAVTGSRTVDGHTIWGRNADWGVPADFVQNYAIVVVAHPDGGNAFLSANWAGGVGVQTGINEFGVAAAQNSSGLYDQHTPGTPLGFLMRGGLEAADTAREFADFVMSQSRTVGSNMVVPDGYGNIMALELTGTTAVAFDTDDPDEDHYYDKDTGTSHSTRDESDWVMLSEGIPDAVIRTNHFLDWGPWDQEPAHLQELQMRQEMGDEISEGDAIESLMASTHGPDWTVHRYFTLYDLITRAPEPIDAQTAIEFLAYGGVGSGMSIHSAVFDTTSLEVWIGNAFTPPGSSKAIDANLRPFFYYDFGAELAKASPEGLIVSPDDEIVILPGQNVDLQATGFDPDGEIAIWRWEIAGPDGFTWSSEIEDPGLLQLTESGIYSITLTVVDDEGNADATPHEISIAVLSLPEPGIVATPTGKGRLEILDGLPVLHIEGSHYDMGYQHGYLLADWIGDIYDKIISLALERMTHEEFELMGRITELYLPDAYRQETNGLIAGVTAAGGNDYSYYEVLAIHTFPDLVGSNCTQFAVSGSRTADGHVIYGRNLDWDTATQFNRSSNILVVAAPDDGHMFAAPSTAGNLAAFTGINEYGVTGATNYSPMDAESGFGLPIGFQVRLGLEKAATAEEFAQILQRQYRSIPIIMVVTDGLNPWGDRDAFALEVSNSRVVVFGMNDPDESHYFDPLTGESHSTRDNPAWLLFSEAMPDAIVRTNHFLDWGPWATSNHLQELQLRSLYGDGISESDAFLSAYEEDEYNSFTLDRYVLTQQLIADSAGLIGAQEAIEILGHGTIGAPKSMHSVVFDATALKLWYAGAIINPITGVMLDSNETPFLYFDFAAAIENHKPNGMIETPADGNEVKLGQSVALEGAAFDLDGDVTGWWWEILGPDGFYWSSNQQTPPAFKPAAVGDYQVRLTVTDNDGVADPTPASAQFSVSNPAVLLGVVTTSAGDVYVYDIDGADVGIPIDGNYTVYNPYDPANDLMIVGTPGG
ncbi:MAG TPA: C45 family autoproteolytic acyltransferase/hydrolase, partial [Candidatus Brocadiia bacterium]|nr:C45 family autoproteolytic acyltransferase/hydrolase [Candidatus Brocadiia bacterium]